MKTGILKVSTYPGISFLTSCTIALSSVFAGKGRPRQGWSSFVLLVLIMCTLSESIYEADWVEAPGLKRLCTLALIVGLLLAKWKTNSILLLGSGLVLGLISIVVFAPTLSEGPTLLEDYNLIGSRLTIWYMTIKTGGVSTDLMPFTILFWFVGWTISFAGSLYVYKDSNSWPIVVMCGIVLLTNLSFLPGEYENWFFVYVLLVIMLMVKLNVSKREEQWKLSGISYDLISGWITIHSAFWLALATIIVAIMLPLKVYVYPPVVSIWNMARTPVTLVEDDIERMLSGFPVRKEIPGRFFGDVLPFIGEISFDGDVLFWADTPYPSYWVSKTYSQYTSGGWLKGDTIKRGYPAGWLSKTSPELKNVVSVQQNIYLNFDTKRFFSGGQTIWMSQDVELEFLEPMLFTLDMSDDENHGYLPRDVQKVKRLLTEQIDSSKYRFVEYHISEYLPDDLRVRSVKFSEDTDGEGIKIHSIILERVPPIDYATADRRFVTPLKNKTPYSMLSLVSLASGKDLKESNDISPGQITDHYLNLPTNLPMRIESLAKEVSRDFNTKYDKVIAIRDHLRGAEYQYSYSIDSPPPGADGVDYFLFTSKTGYSDYYASAMVVMLRTIGIPSRLAVGYASGTFDDETNLMVVKDLDSHGWVQVYFDEYGWIDFEPTPRWAPHQRILAADRESPGIASTGQAMGNLQDGIPLSGDFLDDAVPLRIDDHSNIIGDEKDWKYFIAPVSGIISIIVAIGLFIGVMLYFLWNWGLKGTSETEQAFVKLTRLGRLAGIRFHVNQTPTQYAIEVSALVEEESDAVQYIGNAYAHSKYARGQDSCDLYMDSVGTNKWKSVRNKLISKALSRLIPTKRQ